MIYIIYIFKLPLVGLPWQHSIASQRVGLCAKEDSAHKDNPPATPDVPLNVPAQPRPYLSMHMLDIDASTDTTYVFTCEPCNNNFVFFSTFSS